MEKLHAEFTKSRACRSQDNALVDGKNGAVIRKLMEYGYIASEHAAANREILCAASESVSEFAPALRLRDGESGRAKQTPAPIQVRRVSDSLREAEIAAEVEQYLKPGLSLADLEREALAMSATECARRMNAAKLQLLRQCKMQSPLPPPFSIAGMGGRGNAGAVAQPPHPSKCRTPPGRAALIPCSSFNWKMLRRRPGGPTNGEPDSKSEKRGDCVLVGGTRFLRQSHASLLAKCR